MKLYKNYISLTIIILFIPILLSDCESPTTKMNTKSSSKTTTTKKDTTSPSSKNTSSKTTTTKKDTTSPSSKNTSSKTTVSAGSLHTLAIDTHGRLYAWGWNSFGQLGNGSTDNKKIPTKINHPINSRTWSSISAGGWHSLAIDTHGNLYTWGWNCYGQLGNGSIDNKKTPTKIDHPDDKTWRSVSAGYWHTLAIDAHGRLYAWGYNESGRLGVNSTENKKIPTKINHPDGKTWRSVSAGSTYTLAIDTHGRLYAWGWNGFGQLGNGISGDNAYEIKPAPVGLKTWNTVSTGDRHSLAIDTDGILYAWGQNKSGQLGNGSTNNKKILTPKKIDHPDGKTWYSISAGYWHSLATDIDGRLYAWGENEKGQLGIGSIDTSHQSYENNVLAVTYASPTTYKNKYKPYQIIVKKLNDKEISSQPIWKTITAGREHSLAIDTDGRLYAWGLNEKGQLGDGSTDNRTIPASISMPY